LSTTFRDDLDFSLSRSRSRSRLDGSTIPRSSFFNSRTLLGFGSGLDSEIGLPDGDGDSWSIRVFDIGSGVEGDGGMVMGDKGVVGVLGTGVMGIST
jgi:hypothetical protein